MINVLTYSCTVGHNMPKFDSKRNYNYGHLRRPIYSPFGFFTTLFFGNVANLIKTEVYLHEFIANALPDNMGMVIFDLQPHEGCLRPKTPLGGQKFHEGVDLLKKGFNKSFSTTSKTPNRVQSDLSYNLRVNSYDF
jgi:hypothetical protein